MKNGDALNIDITDTLVRLYVFLAQTIDRCLSEAARISYPETALQGHLAATRATVLDMLSVNKVVKEKVEQECKQVLSLVAAVLDVGRFFADPFRQIFQLDDNHLQIAINWGIGAFRAAGRVFEGDLEPSFTERSTPAILGASTAGALIVRRSMSIASAPEDVGPTEFYIRFVSKPESENPLTHLLWKLKAGDRMYMRPVAAGVFTIKDTIGLEDSRVRVMVAAGTGYITHPEREEVKL